MRFFSFAELSLVLSAMAALTDAATVHLRVKPAQVRHSQKTLQSYTTPKQSKITRPVRQPNSISPPMGDKPLPHFCATFATGMLQKFVVYLSNPADYDLPYLQAMSDRLVGHMHERASGKDNDCNPLDVQTATHPDHPGIAVSFYTRPTCHEDDVSSSIQHTTGYWKQCFTDVTEAFADAGPAKSDIADLTGRFFAIA